MTAIDIQIYCRRPSVEEVDALITLEISHLGWGMLANDMKALELSVELAERARQAGVASTLLIQNASAPTTEEVAKHVRPDFVLIPAESLGRSIKLPELTVLAERLAPHTGLMTGVPVRRSGSGAALDSLKLAQAYASFSRALIVDTCLDPDLLQQCGCTGITCDWDECARIVEGMTLPVMLAGGLNDRNIRDAIHRVRPWGVDACSSLSRDDLSMDLDRCAAFVAAVKNASKEITWRS